MKTYERVISIIMLIVISLSTVATPVAYAAPLTNVHFTLPKNPVYDQSELTKAPGFNIADQGSVLGASTTLFTVGTQKLDLSAGNQDSADRRIPIQVEQMKKKVYETTEDVALAVVNPDNEPFTTTVTDADNKAVSVPISESNSGTTTTVDLAPSNQIRPGLYKVRITDAENNSTEQDFTWGVLAMNFDKSEYHPGEQADIAMAVLNDNGDMVCDASLKLSIQNSGLGIDDTLSTEDASSSANTITVNPQCQHHDFSLEPDYEAHCKFGGAGSYQLQLTATTQTGTHTITDSIQVTDKIPFDLQRVSATRIYPPNTYPMLFNITANQDFSGTVTETVPDSFTITPATQSAAQSYTGMQTVYLNSNDPAAIMSQQIASQSGGLVMPFHGSYPITQGFGAQLTDPTLQAFYTQYGLAGHDGIDFGVPMDTPLYAVDAGTVIWSGPGDYGTMVTILHSWGQTYYGHMSNTSVTVGEHVDKGQLIGYSGMSGEATGPHLHFGMKPNNPDMTNGYYGKIDPMPFLPIGQGESISALGGASNPIANAVYSQTVLGASDSAQDDSVTPTPTDAPSPTPILSPSTTPTPSAGPDSTAATLTPTAVPSAAPVTSGADQVVSPTPTPVASVFSQPTTADNTTFSVLDKQIQLNEEIANDAQTQKVKVITWKVNLKKGQSTSLGYAYQAPRVSPQFYLLGPAKFYAGGNDQLVFQEDRQWQIASDDVGVEWYQNTGGPHNWNGYSWQYRKKIDINHSEVSTSGIPMTIGHDADATGSALSSSWSHTTSSTDSNMILVVGVNGTANPTGVTYGGQSLTEITDIKYETSPVTAYNSFWYLVNPLAGTKTVSVSGGGTIVGGGSSTYYNVNQTTPLGNSNTSSGNSTAPSVTVSSTNTTQLVIDNMANGGNQVGAVTPGTGQTKTYDSSSSNEHDDAGSYKTGASSSTSISWTLPGSADAWGEVAAALNPSTGITQPTVDFMDSGGDATNTNGGTHTLTSNGGFYEGQSETPTADCTSSETGPCSYEFSAGSSGNETAFEKNNVLADTGRRISMWVNFSSLPSSGGSGYMALIAAFGSSQSNYVTDLVDVNSSGKLCIDAHSGGTCGTTALSTGTWYHISVSYVLTSTSVNQANIYLNDTLYASETNQTWSATGTNELDFGILVSPNPNATVDNMILHIDDIYVDSGTDLSDPGAIHVTAKRPYSNGTTNQFTTGGSAGGYGSGNAAYVNERPVNTTDIVNSNTSTFANLTDEYSIEAASVGDVDISSDYPIADEAWGYAEEHGSCTNPALINQGSSTTEALTASYAMYTNVTNNTTYPSGNTDVGMTSCTNGTSSIYVNFAEAGVQIAYTTTNTNTLTNFPVLINLPSDASVKAHAQSSGNDILFTDSTGRNLLPFELESYNATGNGDVTAWVNISSLSSINDTIIYMYYGNPTTISKANASGVWDSNYVGVWHLGPTTPNGSTLSLNDSTSYGNNGTNSSPAVTYTSSGEIDGAGAFVYNASTPTHITVASSTSLNTLTSAMTISAWVKPTSTDLGSLFNRIISRNVLPNTDWVMEMDGSDAGHVTCGNNDNNNEFDFAQALTAGQWYLLTCTLNSSAENAYLNGAFSASGTGEGSIATTGNVGIGADTDGTTGWDGTIDEVQISNIVRSTGWITTEYNNQSAPGSFYSVGNEETSIYAPTLSQLMRHGEWFDSTGTVQPFTF